MASTIESLAAEIAGRSQPLTRNQIRQHARRHGVDPVELLTAVRRLRRPLCGEELEEQRRRSAAGVAKSQRRQRLEAQAAERFAREVDAIHAALTARGWVLEKISDSGSRYYSRNGQVARVSDHAPNDATLAWIEKTGVIEINTLDQAEECE